MRLILVINSGLPQTQTNDSPFCSTKICDVYFSRLTDSSMCFVVTNRTNTFFPIALREQNQEQLTLQ